VHHANAQINRLNQLENPRRMTSRSFSRWVCLLLLGYMALNLILWKLVTEELMTGKTCASGDLARLGYIPESKLCRQNEDSLPRRHIEAANHSGGPVDVITIGDSFSQGASGGKDRYYQDHLATRNSYDVLNIPQLQDIDKISTLSILNNNGYLDKLNPRYVLMECAEKFCLQDLPDTINFDRSIPDHDFRKFKSVTYRFDAKVERPFPFTLDFFSEANLKLIRNSLLYKFSDNAFGSHVYRVKLSKPFFSVSEPDTLLFLDSDIKFRQNYTNENIRRFNQYLNTLSDRLRAKGITLYFMPCVDKYNLYSEYIPHNPYPKSTFFETLRSLPRSYELIDTKNILREELARGEMDVFYPDDTHWSWKASKKIFERVRFK